MIKDTYAITPGNPGGTVTVEATITRQVYLDDTPLTQDMFLIDSQPEYVYSRQRELEAHGDPRIPTGVMHHTVLLRLPTGGFYRVPIQWDKGGAGKVIGDNYTCEPLSMVSATITVIDDDGEAHALTDGVVTWAQDGKVWWVHEGKLILIKAVK